MTAAVGRGNAPPPHTHHQALHHIAGLDGHPAGLLYVEGIRRVELLARVVEEAANSRTARASSALLLLEPGAYAHLLLGIDDVRLGAGASEVASALNDVLDAYASPARRHADTD